MLTIVIVLVGLILGSFLSVLLERLPKNKPGIIAGRSECPHCHRILAWHDLAPLLSYVFLLGRCHYCKARISLLYPALELAVAAVFGSYAYRFGLAGTWSVVDLVVLFGLVALFFFDLRYQILPDIITVPLILLVLGRSFLDRPESLVNMLMTGVVLALIFGLLYTISHGRWLGLGDVKLAMLIGLLFGYPGALGVTLVAIWAGALVGLGLILVGRANMKTALPFGSFWALAAIMAIIIPGPVVYVSKLFIPLFN